MGHFYWPKRVRAEMTEDSLVFPLANHHGSETTIATEIRSTMDW
jgi:hypothetical protein